MFLPISRLKARDNFILLYRKCFLRNKRYFYVLKCPHSIDQLPIIPILYIIRNAVSTCLPKEARDRWF